MSISKYLGVFVGAIVCIGMFLLLVPTGAPTATEWKLMMLGFVLAMMLGAVFGALLDWKAKWKKLDKEFRETVYRVKTIPQCFNLQDALDQRLIMVATRWHEYSQRFVEKGTDNAINQEVETFNKLYSLIEDTFADDRTLLREKDIRAYLPEELKKAS